MQIEVINGKPCMIGRGENLVYQILKETFPKAILDRQQSLVSICCIHDPNERERKETIDIIMCWKHQKIAIRIQNKEKGSLKLQHEDRQKRDLINSDWLVADISEYECENVFNEQKNYLVYLEIFNALYQAGLKP